MIYKSNEIETVVQIFKRQQVGRKKTIVWNNQTQKKKKRKPLCESLQTM